MLYSPTTLSKQASRLTRSLCVDLVSRDRPQGFVTSFITPPLTRKRKAAESVDNVTKSKKQHTASTVGNLSPLRAPLDTPPLTTMDSDDEFMSGLSSQEEEFGGTQESDDGSLGDGMHVSEVAAYEIKSWLEHQI